MHFFILKAVRIWDIQWNRMYWLKKIHLLIKVLPVRRRAKVRKSMKVTDTLNFNGHPHRKMDGRQLPRHDKMNKLPGLRFSSSKAIDTGRPGSHSQNYGNLLRLVLLPFIKIRRLPLNYFSVQPGPGRTLSDRLYLTCVKPIPTQCAWTFHAQLHRKLYHQWPFATGNIDKNTPSSLPVNCWNSSSQMSAFRVSHHLNRLCTVRDFF